MKLPMITCPAELEDLVNEIGFLPFFRCGIPGFSLEECTPADYWFVAGVDGPWEWKGTIAAKGEIAYGKLFNKKAGYVSRQWYPELANYRRDGYDFDARYDDGLASRKSKGIIDLLTTHGACLSYELKKYGGYGKNGLDGFDPVITTLQMQTYITVKGFEYKQDRNGQPYGWGVARYALSEAVFGAEFVTSAYSHNPGATKARICEHLTQLLPQASTKQIDLIIK